jgi:hypothetical protein
MQMTDHRTLGPGFERRLKAALDSVAPRTPSYYNARYRTAGWARSSRPWRLAPALIGAGAVMAMALTAAAATSSANPAVWTQRAVSTIQSVSHIPDNNPNPPQNNAPEPRGTAPVSQHGETGHATPPSARKAEPSDKPQQSERPEGPPRPDESPRPDHSQQPWPSPAPGDPHDGDSNSPPPPFDRGGDHSRH